MEPGITENFSDDMDDFGLFEYARKSKVPGGTYDVST